MEVGAVGIPISAPKRQKRPKEKPSHTLRAGQDAHDEHTAAPTTSVEDLFLVQFQADALLRVFKRHLHFIGSEGAL
eukprot:scaffold380_cov272-Pinguiococcus_pyrenoidosus.AAC.4